MLHILALYGRSVNRKTIHQMSLNTVFVNITFRQVGHPLTFLDVKKPACTTVCAKFLFFVLYFIMTPEGTSDFRCNLIKKRTLIMLKLFAYLRQCNDHAFMLTK